MSQHKHADLMIAYANDTSLVIEVSSGDGWTETTQPLWRTDLHYRIKSTPKKAYVFMRKVVDSEEWVSCARTHRHEALSLHKELLNGGYKVTEIKEVEFY